MGEWIEQGWFEPGPPGEMSENGQWFPEGPNGYFLENGTFVEYRPPGYTNEHGQFIPNRPPGYTNEHGAYVPYQSGIVPHQPMSPYGPDQWNESHRYIPDARSLYQSVQWVETDSYSAGEHKTYTLQRGYTRDGELIMALQRNEAINWDNTMVVVPYDDRTYTIRCWGREIQIPTDFVGGLDIRKLVILRNYLCQVYPGDLPTFQHTVITSLEQGYDPDQMTEFLEHWVVLDRKDRAAGIMTRYANRIADGMKNAFREVIMNALRAGKKEPELTEFLNQEAEQYKP